MKMYAVEVYMNDGLVHIVQDQEHEDSAIVLTTEQVPVLIEWLKGIVCPNV